MQTACFFTLLDGEQEQATYENMAKYINSSCTDKDPYGFHFDPKKPIEEIDLQFLQNADITQCFNVKRGTVLGFGVDIGMMVFIFNNK